jgi:hypothetical protein
MHECDLGAGKALFQLDLKGINKTELNLPSGVRLHFIQVNKMLHLD